MATLSELADRNDLIKIDAGLGAHQQPNRLLYASPRLVAWMKTVLPGMASALGVELSPLEQVAILFEEYCAGDNLAFGRRFHDLNPRGSTVWELKTSDIRVFGWFYIKDHFVAYAADDASRIKDLRMYAGYRDDTLRFRDQLDLDPPKFLPGDTPDVVVSNYSYP